MTEDDKALVDRLREEAADWDEPKRSDEVDVRGMLHKAADRIEQLTTEAERLREALAIVLENAAQLMPVTLTSETMVVPLGYTDLCGNTKIQSISPIYSLEVRGKDWGAFVQSVKYANAALGDTQ